MGERECVCACVRKRERECVYVLCVCKREGRRKFEELEIENQS